MPGLRIVPISTTMEKEISHFANVVISFDKDSMKEIGSMEGTKAWTIDITIEDAKTHYVKEFIKQQLDESQQ